MAGQDSGAEDTGKRAEPERCQDWCWLESVDARLRDNEKSSVGHRSPTGRIAGEQGGVVPSPGGSGPSGNGPHCSESFPADSQRPLGQSVIKTRRGQCPSATEDSFLYNESQKAQLYGCMLSVCNPAAGVRVTAVRAFPWLSWGLPTGRDSLMYVNKVNMIYKHLHEHVCAYAKNTAFNFFCEVSTLKD